MNKKYVFLTDDIHPIGGEQLYVAGKAAYLARNGWDVRIIFPGLNTGKCEIECLQPYVVGGVRGIWRAPFKWGKMLSRIPLRRMLQIVGECPSGSETIVESNTGELAQWGELLASEIDARHVCLIVNEGFREPEKTYDQVLDFFEFKLNRGELYGITEKSLHLLFENYLKIADGAAPSFNAVPMPAVQDITDERLAVLDGKADWTVCHIGRAAKGYVERMIRDMAKFASNHLDKKIRIVFVGAIESRRNVIESAFGSLKNVEIIEMGNMVPIPRELYALVDVVVATSGCAVSSAAEGSMTVVADAGDGMSDGVLGVDTWSFLYREEGGLREGFDETLDRVFMSPPSLPSNIASVFQEDGDREYANQLAQVRGLSSRREQYDCSRLYMPRAALFDRAGSVLNSARISFGQFQKTR